MQATKDKITVLWTAHLDLLEVMAEGRWEEAIIRYDVLQLRHLTVTENAEDHIYELSPEEAVPEVAAIFGKVFLYLSFATARAWNCLLENLVGSLLNLAAPCWSSIHTLLHLKNWHLWFLILRLLLPFSHLYGRKLSTEALIDLNDAASHTCRTADWVVKYSKTYGLPLLKELPSCKSTFLDYWKSFFIHPCFSRQITSDL